MNIGLYQSASALNALERWQAVVAQNITSSQVNGYRRRTVDFTTVSDGEINTDPQSKMTGDTSYETLFPQVSMGISFGKGQTEPTKRSLDVAIQGKGFFEVKLPNGTRAYTRNGSFQIRNDRTLVTSDGAEVLTPGGTPLTLVPNGKPLVINPDGTATQGNTTLGKLSIQQFANDAALTPISGGYFVAPATVKPTPVANPGLMQGYLESSNVSPLHEMVDLVLISRAYEANQKIITTFDQEGQKTLDALG